MSSSGVKRSLILTAKRPGPCLPSLYLFGRHAFGPVAAVGAQLLAVQVDFVKSGSDKCSRVGKYSFYFPAKLVKVHDHIEDVIKE